MARAGRRGVRGDEHIRTGGVNLDADPYLDEYEEVSDGELFGADDNNDDTFGNCVVGDDWRPAAAWEAFERERVSRWQQGRHLTAAPGPVGLPLPEVVRPPTPSASSLPPVVEPPPGLLPPPAPSPSSGQGSPLKRFGAVAAGGSPALGPAPDPIGPAGSAAALAAAGFLDSGPGPAGFPPHLAYPGLLGLGDLAPELGGPGGPLGAFPLGGLPGAAPPGWPSGPPPPPHFAGLGPAGLGGLRGLGGAHLGVGRLSGAGRGGLPPPPPSLLGAPGLSLPGFGLPPGIPGNPHPPGGLGLHAAITSALAAAGAPGEPGQLPRPGSDAFNAPIGVLPDGPPPIPQPPRPPVPKAASRGPAPVPAAAAGPSQMLSVTELEDALLRGVTGQSTASPTEVSAIAGRCGSPKASSTLGGTAPGLSWPQPGPPLPPGFPPPASSPPLPPGLGPDVLGPPMLPGWPGLPLGPGTLPAPGLGGLGLPSPTGLSQRPPIAPLAPPLAPPDSRGKTAPALGLTPAGDSSEMLAALTAEALRASQFAAQSGPAALQLDTAEVVSAAAFTSEGDPVASATLPFPQLPALPPHIAPFTKAHRAALLYGKASDVAGSTVMQQVSNFIRDGSRFRGHPRMMTSTDKDLVVRIQRSQMTAILQGSHSAQLLKNVVKTKIIEEKTVEIHPPEKPSVQTALLAARLKEALAHGGRQAGEQDPAASECVSSATIPAVETTPSPAPVVAQINGAKQAKSEAKNEDQARVSENAQSSLMAEKEKEKKFGRRQYATAQHPPPSIALGVGDASFASEDSVDADGRFVDRPNSTKASLSARLAVERCYEAALALELMTSRLAEMKTSDERHAKLNAERDALIAQVAALTSGPGVDVGGATRSDETATSAAASVTDPCAVELTKRSCGKAFGSGVSIEYVLSLRKGRVLMKRLFVVLRTPTVPRVDSALGSSTPPDEVDHEDASGEKVSESAQGTTSATAPAPVVDIISNASRRLLWQLTVGLLLLPEEIRLWIFGGESWGFDAASTVPAVEGFDGCVEDGTWKPLRRSLAQGLATLRDFGASAATLHGVGEPLPPIAEHAVQALSSDECNPCEVLCASASGLEILTHLIGAAAPVPETIFREASDCLASALRGSLFGGDAYDDRPSGEDIYAVLFVLTQQATAEQRQELCLFVGPLLEAVVEERSASGCALETAATAAEAVADDTGMGEA